ncbi:hypothetical protein, partial [Clostridium perfringens]|uniref:hypothetical protein n=1 Tax=Clostridium perfringens TaxID=1502 RepID=UPI002ACBDC5F
FQTALSIKSENEAERVAKMKELINNINSKWIGKKAISIPRIPDNLTSYSFINELAKEKGMENIYIGIDVNEIEEVAIDITSSHFIPIIGTASSGKSNMLKTISYSIEKTCPSEKFDMYVYDSGDYGLVSLDDGLQDAFYSNNKEDIIQNLLSLKYELDQRRDFIEDEMYMNKGKIRDIDLVKQLNKKIIFIDNIFELLGNI